MRVSVIIAVKKDNPFLRESLAKLAKVTYSDHEILVLPDDAFVLQMDRLKIIPTGNCLPAKKRDIGAENAQGEILAFLDDDAYPSEDWLNAAVRNFEDPEVAAVGGPAVTPPTEEFLRRASGNVYASIMVSGNFRYRYVKGARRLIDDY
ncbi:MAG TPA: glycosyltransferase, partial [Candidatus Omnitrophota bacterium]|nr:glycosyltransferase [Candidatus Omnitrophota bacterium]